MKHFILGGAICLLWSSFSGCSDSDQIKAGRLVSEAQTAFEQGEYNRAKILIDSIHTAYPRQIDARREVQLMAYKIELQEVLQIKAFTDSMSTVSVGKINEATEHFVYEKSEYDELGRYIYKGSEAEKNGSRSYVHAAVDEYGVTQLISSYCGSSRLEHTALRVKSADGTSCVTQTIAYNDGSNYHYAIDGTRYETVTYVGDKDGGVLHFIDLYPDSPLTAEYIGGKRSYSFKIEPRDRKALSATLALSLQLKSRLQMEQENKVAAGKIIYLQRLIEGKENAGDSATSAEQGH